MSSRQRNSTSKSRAAVDRTMPDLTKLVDLTPSASATNGLKPADANRDVDQQHGSYETTDINEVTRRQLNENITAYRYDIEFSTQQLEQPDMSPSQARTIQLRVLDLAHQIRNCQHRLEHMDIQNRQPGYIRPIYYGSMAQTNGYTSIPQTAGVKRPRTSKVAVKNPGSDNDEEITVAISTSPNGDSTAPGASIHLQRLGFWKCHLCTSQKYLLAGSSRVPSAPCKWPLKDVSKMLNHFLDMHTEHAPEERCVELGDALAANKGPLEYWLTRTRSQNVGDGAIINEIVETLQAGSLPHVLRNLNRAAAAFPNSAPEQPE